MTVLDCSTGMRAGRAHHATLVIAAVGGLAVAGCGSTKTVTVTNTIVKEATTTVTTSASATAPTTTAATATATTAAAPGTTPALNGTYNLDQTAYPPAYGTLPNNPHDGVLAADKQWTFMNGSCTGTSCQVTLRRVLSDTTIEDLVLYSNSPTGVYTGAIPGGDGKASCANNLSASVKLSIIVRVGGPQTVGGQTVASRLAAHIFADYQCPGSGPTRDVATYVGTHS